MNRRQFLRLSSEVAAATLGGLPAARPLLAAPPSQIFQLSIEPVALELAPGVTVRTTCYNGRVPGPLLRVRRGLPIEVNVTNRTLSEELVHWHGLHIPSSVDGSAEEGSPVIAPGKSLRYRFMPAPSGTRWYHTHTMAGADLQAATYSGQFGFMYIEPEHDPGHYDHEVFLAVHHWEPSFAPMQEDWRNCPEISYRHASFNDRLLGAAEPLRVRRGERVLFHFLNASATEQVDLALPRHRFSVLALDGNPVPRPAQVEVLSLAVAERVDAIVEMNEPGTWVLGSTSGEERRKGLGLVIEYAGETGAARWEAPAGQRRSAIDAKDWSYARFSAPILPAPDPDELLTLIFEKQAAAPGATGSVHTMNATNTMDRWTINGASFPDAPPLRLREGRRYRLRLVNATGCAHPIHLHRHSFELRRVGEAPLSGIMKDTVNLARYGVVDVDLVADQPGPTLFHCHQQLHMDNGFMRMFEYV